MKRMRNAILKPIAALALAAICLIGCTAVVAAADVTFTNVSYDPTRELYEAYNQLFAARYLEETGQPVEFLQSHGGSGPQALSVANGLEADVVTLALAADIDAIADAGLIEPGWIDEFPNGSSPYTSAIVFVVRAGNPKNIADWGDLVKEGVGVITPNPKTSGGARWNFLAAWAWAEQQYGVDSDEVPAFLKALYAHVLVLDTGARGSTTTFSENGQGDVFIAWENEAYMLTDQYPGQYEIIAPSISILCQPPVAIVDEVVDMHGTRELARAYLEGLYEDEAQRIIADHHYRPSNESILHQYADRFDLTMNLVTIDHFGGWVEAQQTYFADGGAFDQIYEG